MNEKQAKLIRRIGTESGTKPRKILEEVLKKEDEISKKYFDPRKNNLFPTYFATAIGYVSSSYREENKKKLY